MKTKNNAQKTVNAQVRKMSIRGSVVIFSLVLLSWTVTAQDFWKQVLTDNSFGKMAMQMVEQSNESENVEATYNGNRTTNPSEISNEVAAVEASIQIEAYNAQEFAEAEMALEAETRVEDANEVALQIEGYNAQEFAAADMALENETRVEDAIEVTLQIEGYNAREFAAADMALENGTRMEDASEVALQIEGYNAQEFAAAEMALENRTSNEEASEITLSIEAYNAQDFALAEMAIENEARMEGSVEVTFQVEAYDAQKFAEADMINEIKMNENDFSNSAETFIAKSTVTEIQKYAHKSMASAIK